MSQVPYDTRSGWSWPEETASGSPSPRPSVEENTHLPGAFEDELSPEPHNTADYPQEQTKATEEENNIPRSKRYYAPRTCRICLEIVNPSFEPMEGIPSMFNPAPKVQYISEDPESGRLIRPCHCKGSGRYVHEGCLQEWRHADARYGRRNYWECPTCKFKYRLERMRWSRWISSTFLQLFLTIAIMFTTIFILGFVADPIINLYLDPYDTITSIPKGGLSEFHLEDEDASWAEHFLKGMASLGLLGFVKAFFAMSPWHWWNLRQSGVLGGGSRGRRAGTGRDRLENISWSLVIIGVVTFLYAVWQFVRSWSRRTLEKASEHVVDVQGDDDDFEEMPPPTEQNGPLNNEGPPTENIKPDTRKTQ